MTTTTPATGTVLPLAAATDHRIAGRKAATLARLAAAGFPVPPGVVVPAAIFEYATKREVPADVAADLLTAVRCWGEAPLAVRSSGVDEDSAEASYAGLFATVLNVRGDTALLDAVQECWNSAFDARVTSYAGSEPPRLAVLVQPMVAATAAGVAFSADPVTGERGCVVIDATTGIGDRLASGAVTPDRWNVRGEVAHHRSTGEQAAITEQGARSVADLARRAEIELGGPQDIEWALVNDELILLQARPITALPIQPVPIPLRYRRDTGNGRPAISHFRYHRSAKEPLSRGSTGRCGGRAPSSGCCSMRSRRATLAVGFTWVSCRWAERSRRGCPAGSFP